MKTSIQKTLFVIAALGMILVGHAFGQELEWAQISGVTSMTVDPSESTASLAVDGDGSTAWIPASGNSQTALVIQLSKPYLVCAIEVDADISSDVVITAEYFEGGIWKPFAAGMPAAWQKGRIDCSADLVTADQLALRFSGSAPKVYEVRVRGIPAESLSRVMKPARIVEEEPSHPFYPVDNLVDGNPRTIWGVDWKSEDFDWAEDSGLSKSRLNDFFGKFSSIHRQDGFPAKGASLVFEYDQPRIVDEVRIFSPAQQPRTIQVSAQTATGWSTVGTLTTDKRGGWVTSPVNGGSVAATRFRIETVDYPSQRLALGEIELWGRGGAVGRSYIEGDFIGNVTSNAQDFEIRLSDTDTSILELDAGSDLGAELSVQFNGINLVGERVRSLGGAFAYETAVPKSLIVVGSNWVRALPPTGSGKVSVCRMRAQDDMGLFLIHGDATADGSIYSGLQSQGWKEYTPEGQLYARYVDVYAEVPSAVQLQVMSQSQWQSVTSTHVYDDYCRFEYSGSLDSLKVSGAGNINEIRLWASPTTDRAPTLKILSPDEQGDWSLGDNLVLGMVDDPDAHVKVNGQTARMHGLYFAAHVDGAFDDGVEAIVAVATDSEGRIGSDTLSIISGGSSVLALDGGGTFAAQADTVVISGTVSSSSVDVSVDGTSVQVLRGKFSLRVSAPSGLSLKRVEARKHGSGKLLAFAIARVVRYSGPLSIRIDSPSRLYTNQKSISVSGAVSGAGNITVKINGVPALINGSTFISSSTMQLREGDNSIAVSAADSLGRTATKTLVVHADYTKPVITFQTPAAQSYQKGTVTVVAVVKDASPVSVTFNGMAARSSNGAYSLVMAFPDGQATITAIATDEAGNVSQRAVVTFTADSTPPSTFSIGILPAAITNHTSVSIVFSTTDATSGVAGYTLSLDGSAFTAAVSPWTSPNLLDGQHGVVVCAVDKSGNQRNSTAVFVVDTIAPPAPPLLRAVGADGSITVKWNAASDDTVLYRLSRTPEWSISGIRETSSLEYKDTDVTNGESYSYQVIAIDHATNAGPAGIATGRGGVAEEVVDRTNGTVLEYDRAVIVMPKDAAADTITSIKAETVQSTELADLANFAPVGPVYRFTAMQDNGSGSQEVEHVEFSKDLIFVLHYDPAEVPQGFSEQNLGVYYFDENWSHWVKVENAAIDLDQKLIVFSANHFSIYGLQPTPIQPLSPQEIRDKGYSPLASVSRHNGLTVSTQGGTARTDATEFVLPGKNGFSFTLAREYDTATAREDSSKLLVNTMLAFTIGDHLTSQPSVTDYVRSFTNVNTLPADIFSNLEKTCQQQGDYAYSMGIGWRLNLPYVSTLTDNVVVRLPSGGVYQVTEMTPIKSDAINAFNNSSTRVLAFENHFGEDFTFLAYQSSTPIALQASLQAYYTMPAWTTTKAVVILKDGTIYTFNGDGSISQIDDPQGTNRISFAYNGRQLNTIKDSLGRTLTFAYDTAKGIFPRIHSITLSSQDGRTSTVTYTQSTTQGTADSFAFLPLLTRVTDGANRSWSYSYSDTIIVPGDEGGGVPIDFLQAINNLNNNAGSLGSLPTKVSLGTNSAVGVAYCLCQIKGPGVGQIDLTTQQEKYYQKNLVFKLLEPIDDLTKPAGTTSVRLMTTSVSEKPSPSSNDTKTTNYTYTMGLALNGQTIVLHSLVQDGRSTVALDYGYWKKTALYYSSQNTWTVNPTEYEAVPFETMRTTYLDPASADPTKLFEVNSRTYDATSLRLTGETRTRSASLYTKSAYTYDATWGNITLLTQESGWQDESGPVVSTVNTTKTYTGSGIPAANLAHDYLNIDAIPLGPISGSITKHYIQGLPITEVVGLSVPSEAAGSATGSSTTYSYDENGRLTEQVVSDVAGESSSTQYTYGSDLLLAKSSKQLSGSIRQDTAYIYDFNALQNGSYTISSKDLGVEVSSGNFADLPTTTSYDGLWGLPVTQTAADGAVTSYTYDGIGRVASITKPHAPNEGAPLTSISYDDLNDLVTVTGPRGQTDVYGYDDLGQLRTITKKLRPTDSTGAVVSGNAVNLVVNVGYDVYGDINSIVDQRSNVTSFAYDALGRLSSTTQPPANSTDSTRGQIVISRDDQAGTVTTTDERGNITIEGYDIAGHLVFQRKGFMDANDTPRTAHTASKYDGLGRQVWKQDERGGVTLTLYDGLGRVAKTVMPGGSFTLVKGGVAQSFTASPTTSYEYNDVGVATKETYTAGTQGYVTKKEVNGLGWLLATEKTVTDPDSGAAVTIRSEYGYDNVGRKIREYDANDLAAGKTTFLKWEYTARGKVSAEYDRSGAKTAYTYDLEDNLKTVADPREGGDGRFTGTYAYDDAGRMVYADMPGHDGGGGRAQTHVVYDPRGNAINQANPDGSTIEWSWSPRNKAETESTKDASGRVILSKSYTYDAGAYQRQMNLGGLYSTQTVYDALGRLIKSTRADGGSDLTGYNEAGDVTWQANGNDHRSFYTIDALGRRATEKDASGGQRTYEYDPLGKLSKITDALGRVALYENDELGRLIEERRADGARYSYRYDEVGNMSHSTDPNGTSTTFSYTPTYRVETVAKSQGSQSGSGYYDYDVAGNLTSAVMDGVSAAYSVNAYGERTSVSRGGASVRYSIDAAGRRTSVSVLDGTTTLSATSYQYSGSSLLTSVTGWVLGFNWNMAGQLASESLANGTSLSMGYDASGRVASLGWSGATGLPSYSFTYDKAGNITAKNGGNYAYDELERLLSSRETGPFGTDKALTPWTVDTDYAGKRELVISPEDTDVTLDAGSASVGARFGRSIELTGLTLFPKVANHRVKAENLEVYLEDSTGNYSKNAEAVVSVSTQDGNISVSFTPAVMSYGVKVHCLYDERKIDYSVEGSASGFANAEGSILRVQYVERDRSAAYSYDRAGNRLNESISESVGPTENRSYQYWAGTDRVKADGKYGYQYDANGNMTEKGSGYQVSADGTVVIDEASGEWWKYSYDLWGRMVKVEHKALNATSTEIASYTYDPDGLRIGKSTTQVTTRYWYGIDGEVAAEKRVSGTTTRLRYFVYAAGSLVGYEENVNGTTKRYWATTDQIGSVTSETDAGGELVGRREYVDFGQAGSSQVTSAGHESLTWYSGKEFDADASLYYYNARWMDPGTGRFTTEDTAKDQANWYAYVGNNPLTRTDPTGLADTPFGSDTAQGALAWKDDKNGVHTPASTNPPIQNDQTKELIKGLLEGIWEGTLLPGMVDALKDPLGTVKKIQTMGEVINQIITDYVNDPAGATLVYGFLAANAIGKGINGYLTASPYDQGRMIGRTIPAIATVMATVGMSAISEVIGEAKTAQEEAAVARGAIVDPAKFTDYIFKEGATHGKDAVFRGLGYSKADSATLTGMFETQAAARFEAGDYTLGKLDQYGQRINIEIQVPGIGSAAGRTSYINSGWMIQANGTITLNTPFTGFTR